MALPFLEKVFTYEAVLKILIHKRCREAEIIQKKKVVENLAVESRTIKNNTEKKVELYAMFPPRRQWVHIGNSPKRHLLTSKEKNERCLFLTAMREYQKEGDHPEWYRLLDKSINNIIHGALTDKKLFSKPKVTVIEKKRDENKKLIECRPICLFKTLEQQITASLYNRAFSQLFDSFFYENSLAFRPHKDKKKEMSHLKAIKKIKEFRKEHKGIAWVAECDMKKFFDTIDHDIIKKRFNQLLLWCKQAGNINQEEWRILKNAIYSYVDCFRFYKDVYKYNKKPNHPIWKNVNNSIGYTRVIKWVMEEIIERSNKKWKFRYRTKYHHKYQLGVPQGGAMSGIIANVMMHFVDIELKKYWQDHSDFLYIRFCDDMTMMGVDKMTITSAFERYSKMVELNHLYVHDSESFTSKKVSDFWNSKTKVPYRWGQPGADVFPWITFVGYDVNWDGETRIRRSTVKKEIKKQFDKRAEIEYLLLGRRGYHPQWSMQFILNSLHKRMIGMSVGRVPIWDYKSFNNKCSWANAFTELTDNHWSRTQLRQLDRHRNLMMRQFSKRLNTLDYSNIKPSDKNGRTDSLWYFGKPFSYFGQVLKKW